MRRLGAGGGQGYGCCFVQGRGEAQQGWAPRGVWRASRRHAGCGGAGWVWGGGRVLTHTEGNGGHDDVDLAAQPPAQHLLLLRRGTVRVVVIDDDRGQRRCEVRMQADAFLDGAGVEEDAPC